MPNAKTEHSIALRQKTATKWNKEKEKLGQIKQFKAILRDEYSISQANKISNKSNFIKQALRLLNEHGEVK